MTEPPAPPQTNTGVHPLPPQAVAGIDQRAGQCDAALDDLIARWRMIRPVHGSAAATGVLAGDFYSTQIRGFPNIIDLLAFAIARLADTDDQ